MNIILYLPSFAKSIISSVFIIARIIKYRKKSMFKINLLLCLKLIKLI